MKDVDLAQFVTCFRRRQFWHCQRSLRKLMSCICELRPVEYIEAGCINYSLAISEYSLARTT